MLLLGVRSRTGRPRDRDSAEGDDSPQEVVQDELVLRRHTAVLRVQVECVQAFAARRHQVRHTYLYIYIDVT